MGGAPKQLEREPGADLIALERYLNLMRTQGELQKELGVSKDYIAALKFHGLKMPGGKASIRMVRTFLETCDTFQIQDRG